MGKILNKLSLATGVDCRNNFDLSCFHATTSHFYLPRVTYFHEFVPGESWRMDARCSVQCLPMIKPVIADVKVHNRFFFVPYYSICNHWNEFLAETPISNGITASTLTQVKIPFAFEATFVKMFNADANGFTTSATAQNVDYKVGSNLRHFTEKGRVAYSILSGLGYAFNFKNVQPDVADRKGEKLSLLPLLAYLKVYLDWYNNSSFDNKLHLSVYFDLLHTTGEYTHTDLNTIISAVCNIYLEKDYFTSATLYPVGTNSSSLGLAHSVNDITVQGAGSNYLHTDSVPTDWSNGTPIVKQNSTDNSGVITKYSLDAVNALTDYVKRHQLAGLQPFNRILAEYGVTLKDEELKRSTFIGDVVEDLNIHQVVNQSYADNTALGERAGLASGGSSKNLDFKNENFGAIICVTTIVPKTSYPDGLRKHVLRTERFDFFTPSVEQLGVEPVLCSELYNRYNGGESYTPPAVGSIFGYLPRYAAYKTALDSISGDFAIESRRELLDPWILQRKFNTTSSSTELNSISENFTVADPSKVNNIFADNTCDSFIIFNMYHVSASLPMHKLWDDYQWSNEEDNPKHVTLPNQGVQLT